MNIKEINKLIKSLNEEKNSLKDKNDSIFDEYWDMEGMYGTMASDDWDYGQGMRGYHYEYPAGMKEKEEAEREAFLKNSNYNANQQRIKEIANEVSKLENEKSIIKHGMPKIAWEWYKSMKEAEAELAEVKKKIAYCKAHYEEELNKFNKGLE